MRVSVRVGVSVRVRVKLVTMVGFVLVVVIVFVVVVLIVVVILDGRRASDLCLVQSFLHALDLTLEVAVGLEHLISRCLLLEYLLLELANLCSSRREVKLVLLLNGVDCETTRRLARSHQVVETVHTP